MADDIIQFSPGAKVTAEETNENNLLLKEWALDNSESQAYINAKMTQLTNDLNNQIGAINTQISSLNTQISSINNSKISAAISKTAKGYILFSNGMLIQWGHYAVTSNNQSVTFLKPFSNTNYFAYATFEDKSSRLQNSWGFPTSKGASGCKFVLEAGNSVGWIAIGY